MTEDPLQDSLTKLRQGLEVLLSPYDFLGISEPQGPLSAEHLAALLDARTRFGVDETHLQPNLNAAQRFAERLCGPNRRGSLEDRVLELLATVAILGLLIFSAATYLTAYAGGMPELLVYRFVSGLGEAMQLTALLASS